jgi:hypothetical protein
MALLESAGEVVIPEETPRRSLVGRYVCELRPSPGGHVSKVTDLLRDSAEKAHVRCDVVPRVMGLWPA